MAKQKVGVLGSGIVAQTLAKGFAAEGFAVQIGTRDPAKLAEFGSKTGIAVGTFHAVAAAADLVILAVKGTVAEAVAVSLAEALAGKTVIDTNNPIADEPPQGGILRYFTAANESLLERLQSAVPQAHFVKAWSCVGSGFMIHPKFASGRPAMFIAGDDAGAKSEVSAILALFGWSVEDIGGAVGGRAIEPLCQLWCAPGLQRGDWAHAFAVLRP